jgi:hypothetical protein
LPGCSDVHPGQFAARNFACPMTRVAVASLSQPVASIHVKASRRSLHCVAARRIQGEASAKTSSYSIAVVRRTCARYRRVVSPKCHQHFFNARKSHYVSTIATFRSHPSLDPTAPSTDPHPPARNSVRCAALSSRAWTRTSSSDKSHSSFNLD